MKKKIDIEKLVQWAMRDELPKGQAVAASPWDLIIRFATLGVRVQTGGYQGDGFGFTPGAPHEDALAVADAMAALGTEARFNDAAEVAPLFGDLAGIAGDAIKSIMVASFDPRSIVISNATMGTRPKWQFEHPTPYQMFTQERNAREELRSAPLVHGIDADGVAISIRKNRGRKAMREAFDLSMSPRSPLDWQCPAPLHVGECRAEYVAWHGALVSLAGALAGRLKEFEPTMPAAAAMPWITGEAPASRIVARRDLGAVDLGLPLAPRRRAAGKPVESPIEAETRAAYNLASRTKRRKVAGL